MKKTFKSKSLKSGVFSKVLTAGVLACVLSCGFNHSVYAAETKISSSTLYNDYKDFITIGNYGYYGGPNGEVYFTGPVYIATHKTTGEKIIFRNFFGSGEGEDLKFYSDTLPGYPGYTSDTYTYSVVGTSGTTYTAGNGIIISSDNKVSVKAGTNVTVDENGVSVTGNGSVSSGNTGLINGGTAYSELRPSANGNYVKYKNSI